MKNVNLPIDLKDNNFLIENDFIMITKAGKLWRCGKGYRKDWNKLIGKSVLLHEQAFILISRIKQDGKWYLVFKDEKHIYTERQDKALHNKNLAKDVVVEEVKPEMKYQLCLPPARTAIDFIIQNELHPLILKFNNEVKLKKYKSKPIPSKYYKAKYYNLNNDFQSKFDYLDICLIKLACVSKTKLNTECRNIVKKCMIEYHPDRTHKDTDEEFTLLSNLFNRISA